ncbi:MAG: DedA family protein [Parcubacteria group bacterium]
MGLTESLIQLFTTIIEKSGYLGVGFLMTLESMVAPVPSEAVMPFAGFLWFEGKMSLWLIVIASTAGSIIGSLLSYWVGAYGGRPFIKRFGRYLLLNEHDLEVTEGFFNRYGEKTIFISRFIPIIRHLISLPAGVGKMRMGKFLLYTVLGAGIWNAFLAYMGYLLGENWERIRSWGEVVDVVLIIGIIGLVILFIKRHLNRNKHTTPSA